VITWFGVLSFIILIISVTLLWQYKKTEKKRFAIDASLINIEEILDALSVEEKVDYVVLNEMIDKHNKYVEDYNQWISNYPGKVPAKLVGFEKEKKIKKMPQ